MVSFIIVDLSVFLARKFPRGGASLVTATYVEKTPEPSPSSPETKFRGRFIRSLGADSRTKQVELEDVGGISPHVLASSSHGVALHATYPSKKGHAIRSPRHTARGICKHGNFL